mgnify:CR=1 FL=1
MINKTIVMVESHYRSRSWFLALKNIGLSHIISVMPEEYNRFKTLGFPEKNILNLYYNNETKNLYLHSIEYYENFLNIKMNKIVLMDRTLRKKNNKYISKYLNFLTNKLDEFFIHVKPKVIFIEPTWTHEILICKFAKKYNIPIIAPVKDKLLPNNFLAFKDENHIDFYHNSDFQKAKINSILAIDIVKKDTPIQYFQKFNKRNSFDLAKLPKLFRLIKLSLLNLRNPNIQNSVINDIYIKCLSIIRAKIQLSFVDFKILKDIKKNYVFVTLHVQPEASIDVVGQKYSNQIESVRSIAKTLSSDYILLIKEHSHAIGNRSFKFYRDLTEIPNLVLLHPEESSRDAIKKAALVISNTGTSSLEAAILGIPAVTTTKMFFHELMIKETFNPFEENVMELLKRKYQNKFDVLEAKFFDIYKGSLEGNCGDFQTDKNVLDDINIKNLQGSFKSIIKGLL